MQVRSRDVALIAASVAVLLLAALLPQILLKLRLQQLSVAAVAVLVARALFLVLLGAIAFRCWDVRQNRVLLGGRKPVPAAQPGRRRQSWVGSTPAEQRGQAAAQPAAAATYSAAATAAADFHTAEEPNQPAAALQQGAFPDLAHREDVRLPSSDWHTGPEYVTGISQTQPRVSSPSTAHSTGSAAAPEPLADATPVPHGGGVTVAVSAFGSGLAAPSHAVIGSDSSPVGSPQSVPSGGAATTQQQARQQLGDTAVAEAASTQDFNDGMAPKTLQQARAEMLQRQEAAKARHAEEQRAERQAQRRRRLDEADARLEAWRSAKRAAEAAEEASWSQLTAQRRAEEARRQLLQEQDDEYQQALRQDAEAAEQRRQELDTQRTAADARRLAAEGAWSVCARVAAEAVARLSQCPEPEPDAAVAATLSLRLPHHPVQRRRFSAGARVADVYAWAQLALLQGICPTMDAQLQQLQQQAPNAVVAAAGDAAEAASSDGGSGSEAATAGVAAMGVGQSNTAVSQLDVALPADVDEDWVWRWTEGEAGSGSGSSWAWRDGWRLVQTYPRRPLPREWAAAETRTDGTIGDAGLTPQAALAVEQCEDAKRT